MPLIALDPRLCPAALVSNVLALPEVCPDQGKLPFSLLIEPVLERDFSSIFANHRQAEPNLSSQPRFLPSPTMIENP
jgi:hypothetical protein